MKKNFTKAVFMALTVACMGTFNSCKDNDLSEDIRIKTDILNDKYATLDEVVKAQGELLTELKNKVDNIKSCDCMSEEELKALIESMIKDGASMDEVRSEIEKYIANLATTEALNSAKEELNNSINLVNSSVGSLETKVNELNNSTTEIIAKLEAANLEGLTGTVDSLKNVIAGWGPKLEETVSTANKAYELAKKDSTTIAELKKTYEEMALEHDSLKFQFDSLANEMDKFATKEALSEVLDSAYTLHKEAIAYTDSVNGKTVTRLGELEQKYDSLETVVTELKEKVETIYTTVQSNSQKITAMQGYLNKLITNITIQGVSNPVFGSFAFPWGIQSNMLIGYFGESDVEVRFPTIRTANYVYKDYILTAKDAEMLGSSVESFTTPGQAVLVDETEGNAGKIYMTINPTNVDFEGTNFSLVNSQDKNSPVKLGTLTKSNAVLQFGVNRAANNGFYEAPATFTAENIPTTGVNKMLIYNSLKEVAKDVLDYKNGVNIKASARKMFNVLTEIDCELDANGIKAAWNVNGEDQSVYSKYEVAAFAVKPLSYAFLYDANVGSAIGNKIPRLPVITPITDAFLNDLINFDNLTIPEISLDVDFHLDGVELEIPQLTLDFSQIHIDDLGNLVVKVPYPVYDIVENEETGEYELIQTGEELKDVPLGDDVAQGLEDAIKNALAQAGVEMSEEIMNQLSESLNSQLNDVIAQIESEVNNLIQNELEGQINGQLNSAIKDMMDQIKDQVSAGTGDYIDKANGYINEFNTWTERLNKLMNKAEELIDNVNSKLQVTMLYYGADGQLHQMSNNKNMPTTFYGEGVANVYPTSYTGEIIAPAFKKFIAVTNVFKGNESAQNGNAECKAALDAVNSGTYFNKVISGNRYGIAAENLKKGYVYEIFYSGLDYSGKISARKFYVTVK